MLEAGQISNFGLKFSFETAEPQTANRKLKLSQMATQSSDDG